MDKINQLHSKFESTRHSYKYKEDSIELKQKKTKKILSDLNTIKSELNSDSEYPSCHCWSRSLSSQIKYILLGEIF